MAKDLIDELRDQIAWMQNYERYGGLMTPPRAYAILCALENAHDRILNDVSEISVLEATLRAERSNRDAQRQNRL